MVKPGRRGVYPQNLEQILQEMIAYPTFGKGEIILPTIFFEGMIVEYQVYVDISWGRFDARRMDGLMLDNWMNVY